MQSENKKILFVATVTQHFYYFHIPYLKLFQSMGWQVDVASSGDIDLPYCTNRYELPIKRSPLDKDNIHAYKMLKKIIKDNHYDIIHCHTPMGGILARMAAASQRKHGTKVLYTAHGFHFYKGASKLNWLIFFPIEYIMSMKTDGLITINEEDYLCAKKHFKAKKIFKVNGVGYNTDKYFPICKEEKARLKKEKGYSDDEILLIYVAELNANKNQGMLIKSVKELAKKGYNVRLLLVGTDNYNGIYQEQARSLNIDNRIDFLGHREDVDTLVHISDIAVASSLREGLPVNVMESLACGLPVVLGDNRGHRVLGLNNINGFIVSPNDYLNMTDCIERMISDKDLYRELSENAEKLVKPFAKDSVVEDMKKIYKEFI